MAVSVTYSNILNVVETVGTIPGVSDGNGNVTHNAFNYSKTLNASSSPTASQGLSFEKSLSGGAATIDFTSFTGTNGATYNLDALRLRVLMIKAKSTNAANIVVAEGGTNGLSIGGTVTAYVGGSVTLDFGSSGPLIGASDKTLDLTGSGTETLQITVVAGG